MQTLLSSTRTERRHLCGALLAIALGEGADGFVVGVPLNTGARPEKGASKASAAHAVRQSKQLGWPLKCLAFARELAALVGALGMEVVVIGEGIGELGEGEVEEGEGPKHIPKHYPRCHLRTLHVL
jgi:hypothetical protein